MSTEIFPENVTYQLENNNSQIKYNVLNTLSKKNAVTGDIFF